MFYWSLQIQTREKSNLGSAWYLGPSEQPRGLSRLRVPLWKLILLSGSSLAAATDRSNLETLEVSSTDGTTGFLTCVCINTCVYMHVKTTGDVKCLSQVLSIFFFFFLEQGLSDLAIAG